MTGRRIGSVFAQSKYSDGRYIEGANGTRSRPWEDVLYDYFLLKFNSHFTDKFDVYSPTNRAYETAFGTHHFHVFLNRSSGKVKQQTRIEYIDTYGFELYSNVLSSGGLTAQDDAIDFMVDEMQRVFMRYVSHSIAGIDVIDKIEVYPVQPPETEGNPFQNVYKRLVTIEVKYVEHFLYPYTLDWEVNHYGSRYPAGAFKEEIEDPTY